MTLSTNKLCHYGDSQVLLVATLIAVMLTVIKVNVNVLTAEYHEPLIETIFCRGWSQY
jgi:hypothetical protein